MKAGQLQKNIAGIGLRSIHKKQFLQNPQKIKKTVSWLEVHSENYYGDLNPQLQSLLQIRKDFPISLHCVGNSLGSACGLDLNHLKKLKKLIKKTEPFLISDHISWGKVANAHLNDLLPIPYSSESLKIIAQNVAQMQDFLGRQILVENPSTYLAFKNNDFSEVEFINALCKKAGCGLLLDVNNIFVSARNNAPPLSRNFAASQQNATTSPLNRGESSLEKCFEYLDTLDKNIVGEIHLAGHSVSKILENQEILIDTHNDLVRGEVWQIYQMAIKKFGKIPSLIEWDLDIPKLEILLNEARKINSF
jgi:uncharacterized protein (UPF0276 family)